MKRIITGLIVGALALALLCGCSAKNGGEAVSVESVGLITGVGAAGLAESYAGKVVSGETAELKKDADKTILEVYVEEGDMVKAGDLLFSYDTEAMQLSLEKLRLERESYDNAIAAAKSEIEELEKERSKAKSDQQLSYTLQIDSRQADIREAEYNAALKDKEISAMEASMENTEVVSPIAGRVMSVGSADSNSSPYGGDYYDSYGGMGGGDSSDAFVTVMDVSSYRVEGNINELNRGSLYEGMRVIVRSRIDGTQVWRGVIDSIDWEKPVTGGNQSMYYGVENDEMTSSSKYPFYVVLDSTEELLLGQHVYIEPDMGQEDGTAEALMLPAWYIVDDGYVWAADAKDKLEKRPVELGAYNEETGEYEILSGLDYDDYIAFPEEGLSAGMDVVYYDESSFGGAENYGEEEFYGEDYYGEEYYGEEYSGDEFYYGDSSADDAVIAYGASEESYDDGSTEELRTDGLVSEEVPADGTAEGEPVPAEDAEG